MSEDNAEFPRQNETGNRRDLVDRGRSLFNPEGKLLLAVPNHEMIAALSADDPRITSFAYDLTALGESMVTSDGKVKAPSISEPSYMGIVSSPLAAQVMKDFPDVPSFKVRGIAASIDGTIHDGTSQVKDLREVLKLGDEQGRAHMNVASLDIDDETGKPSIHYRVNQYLMGGSTSVRWELPKDDAEKVFPVLLVYDPTKLRKPPRPDEYRMFLPEDPQERASAILKAYVLPYPPANM